MRHRIPNPFTAAAANGLRTPNLIVTHQTTSSPPFRGLRSLGKVLRSNQKRQGNQASLFFNRTTISLCLNLVFPLPLHWWPAPATKNGFLWKNIGKPQNPENQKIGGPALEFTFLPCPRPSQHRQPALGMPGRQSMPEGSKQVHRSSDRAPGKV